MCRIKYGNTVEVCALSSALVSFCDVKLLNETKFIVRPFDFTMKMYYIFNVFALCSEHFGVSHVWLGYFFARWSHSTEVIKSQETSAWVSEDICSMIHWNLSLTLHKPVVAYQTFAFSFYMKEYCFVMNHIIQWWNNTHRWRGYCIVLCHAQSFFIWKYV